MKQMKIEDWFNLWGGDHNIKLDKKTINVLVGPNGSGKTTTLDQISRAVDNPACHSVYFNNEFEGGNVEAQRLLNTGTTTQLASFATSSEGQRIMQCLGRIAYSVGQKIRSMSQSGHNILFVMLDAIDSGMSINNIRYLKEEFFNLVIEDCKNNNIEVYIVTAANSYEMTKGCHCIDVSTGKEITFKDYEEYANFICGFQNEG